MNLPHWLNHETWGSPRWKAAIARRSLSKPMQTAMKHGIINQSTKLLDFGCGRGDDVTLLSASGIPACGYDPYHQNYTNLLGLDWDVVSLIYVLNVIETPEEVPEVLRYCWELTTKYLVVSVRCENKKTGYTNLGTWQTYWTQKEFISLIANTLGVVQVKYPVSGIAIVEKQEC